MGYTLSQYLTQVRRLLKDPQAATYTTSDLTAYINESREQCALESESVRFLWAYDIAGQYTTTGTVTAGSTTLSGVVSTAAVAIGDRLAASGIAPGAFAVAKTADTITMNAPAIGTASGTTLTGTPQLTTRVGQEVYLYGAAADPALGYQRVIQCKGIAVNWGGALGSTLTTLTQVAFSNFQGFLGYYGPNLLGNPTTWTRYSTYARLRPIPSSVMPMQWDAVCTPVPLIDDSTPDVVPTPFDQAVKYHACWLALLGAQRKDDAADMQSAYETYVKRANSFVQRTMVANVYR